MVAQVFADIFGYDRDSAPFAQGAGTGVGHPRREEESAMTKSADRWFGWFLAVVAVLFLLTVVSAPAWKKEPLKVNPSARIFGG